MSLLLPSLGQTAVAFATFAVATICVGLGQLVGARRPAVALVAGWGVAGIALLAANTIAGVPLPLAMAAVGVVGLVGLALAVQGSFEEEAWASAGRTLLLAVPFLCVASAITPAGYDEYSHWLPNVGYLYLHGHFPTLANPNVASLRPAYPYGLAFVGLAASALVFHLAEGAGIVWNALLLVAFASLCGDIVAAQIRLRRGADYVRNPITARTAWGIAAVGLLAATMLSPSFSPRLFLANDGDGATGSVTGIVTATVMLWVAADLKAAADRLLMVAAAGLCCAALVNIRPDGLPLFALVFIAAVATVPLERRTGREIRPAMLLLLLPAPLLGALLWREYQVTAIPDAAFPMLPLAAWHWATLVPALGRMLLVAVGKAGHFGLLLILVGTSLAAIDTPGSFTPLQRGGVVMAAVLGLGQTAIMAVLYLVADVPTAADAFWRASVHIGPALVAGGVSLLPSRIWDWPRTARIVCIAAPTLALLLPVAFVGQLRVDSPRQSHAAYLRAVAADLAGLTAGAASVTLVDADDPRPDLGTLLPVRYALLVGSRPTLAMPVPAVEFIAGSPPTHIGFAGATPVDADAGRSQAHRREDMAAVLAAPFVWFHDGGTIASELAGMTLAPGSSYLLKHRDGGSDLVRSWPLPRSR